MQLAVLNCDSVGTQNLIEVAEHLVEVILCNDLEELASMAGEVDLFALDYDADKKGIDKFLKAFKKDNPDCKVLLVSNVLTPKELVKHQQSKSGADIYLRSPVTNELLKSIFEPFFDVVFEGDEEESQSDVSHLSEREKTIQTRIIQDHQADAGLSAQAQLASDAIEAKFKIAFPEEQTVATRMLRQIEEQEQAEEEEAKYEEGLSLDDEVSLEESEDEISLTDNENEKEKEPDMSGHDETDLPLDDIQDLELGGDDTDSVALSDDGLDMTIDDTALDLAGDDLGDTVAEVADSSELDMSLGDDDLLDISGDDDVELVATVEDDSELDLGGEVEALDLAAEGDVAETLDIVDEMDLDSEPVAQVKEEVESLDDDASLDLAEDISLGDDDLSLGDEVEETDLSLGAEEEDADLSLGGDDLLASDDSLEESLDLGEDIDVPGDDELSFNSDEPSLAASDLPEAPEEIDGLAFGGDDNLDVTDKDLSFDSGDDEEMSDDVMAKLAEIDSMMDDEPTSVIVQDEATGEHVLSSEDHAALQMSEIEDMTEIMATDTENFEELEDLEQVEELDDQNFEDADMFASSSEEEDDIIEEPIDEIEEEIVAAPVKAAPGKTKSSPPPAPVSQASMQSHNEFVQHHGEELTRYNESLKNMREERERLMAYVAELEQKNDELKREKVIMKAELDEKKIEIAIIKKRQEKQIEEMKYQLDIANEKKEILEEKNKHYEAEYEKLNRKVRVDLNKVRSREQELESKLELLRADAETQIRNRDQKILELKRKIDTMSFDIESVHAKEQKTVSSNYQLEEKMQKVIRTLRRAIGELEEDGSNIRSLEELKKNLDV